MAVFLLDFLLGGSLTRLIGLCPRLAIGHFMLWQFFTYMFVHAGVLHLVFNMLALWMFGGSIEEVWGSRRFLFYYFLCGVGAAFFVCAFAWNSVTVGSSGAIFGILAAFGMLFPDAIVLAFFLFPMRARYFVLLFAAIELYVTVASVNDRIAHFAHLGGMLVGYLYLKFSWRLEVALRAYRRARKERERLEEQRKVIRDTIEEKITEDRVNVILDKIRLQGLESLTREEKRILEEVSRKLREKDGEIVNLERSGDNR